MVTRMTDRHFATSLSLDTLDVAAHTVDTTQLAEIVKQVFLLSLDGRLSPGMRGNFNALGVQLREQLRKLLREVFEGDVEALRQANAEIGRINGDLKQAVEKIDRAADSIEQLGALVGALDKLIGVAGIVL